MGTVEPRVFATYRKLTGNEEVIRTQYELIANRIKKYGCIVSKVSDSADWMRIYFEIPKDSYTAFLEEEVRQNEGTTKE